MPSSHFCDLASEKLLPFSSPEVSPTPSNLYVFQLCFFTDFSELPYCCLNMFLLRYKIK